MGTFLTSPRGDIIKEFQHRETGPGNELLEATLAFSRYAG